MKFRICIDCISLDGLAWSTSQRLLFERTFAAVLRDAIASQAGGSVVAFNARRVGLASLSIGSIDAGNPEQAARALALPLTTQVLPSRGGRIVGTTNAGAS